jgi:hypothetical protein
MSIYLWNGRSHFPLLVCFIKDTTVTCILDGNQAVKDGTITDKLVGLLGVLFNIVAQCYLLYFQTQVLISKPCLFSWCYISWQIQIPGFDLFEQMMWYAAMLLATHESVFGVHNNFQSYRAHGCSAKPSGIKNCSLFCHQWGGVLSQNILK